MGTKLPTGRSFDGIGQAYISPMHRTVPLALIALCLTACTAKDPSAAPVGSSSSTATTTLLPSPTPKADSASQISQYIRRMFQDRDGRIWFGTTGDGVARYDGTQLEYFTPANGFSSNWVSSMVQDDQGDIWFGTGGGVSRFDGTRFHVLKKQDGLVSDQVWCTLLDRNGGLWFGTEEGVSRYDGQRFTSFPLPAADLSAFPYYKYPKQINWMIQDRRGAIWFASNGAGVFRYDGTQITRFTEKEGLCNNFVETILEDRNGDIWFGTRYGGLCRHDPMMDPGPKAFTRYGEKELPADHIWTLYQTSDAMLWIAVAKNGLCRYDGSTFTCYDERDGEGLRVVQSLMEDREGRLWIGTSNGVYHYEGGRFANWTKADAQGLARP